MRDSIIGISLKKRKKVDKTQHWKPLEDNIGGNLDDPG